MMLKQTQNGFTLIELMIVVAILGILAATAILAYQNYTKKSAERACMIETKSYANKALVEFSDGATTVSAATLGACRIITTPASSSDTIVGTPIDPGTITVTCELSDGATCS